MSWLKGPVESDEFGETLSKGLTKANELARTKCPVESGEFGESGEFSENLPKGLTKANELAQRAPWKAAMWRKRRTWRKFAKGFDENK